MFSVDGVYGASRYMLRLINCKVHEHFTSLQFLVPMRRAMEQKLLKYVPCSTLNSDSSAPLHWTTQHACCSLSSSPGRSLVGVWHREFPSVSQTQTCRHTETHLYHGLSLGRKFVTRFLNLHTRSRTYSKNTPNIRSWQKVFDSFLSTHTYHQYCYFNLILHWHTYCYFWMPFLCIWMYTQIHKREHGLWFSFLDIQDWCCTPAARGRELSVAWQQAECSIAAATCSSSEYLY